MRTRSGAAIFAAVYTALLAVATFALVAYAVGYSRHYVEMMFATTILWTPAVVLLLSAYGLWQGKSWATGTARSATILLATLPGGYALWMALGGPGNGRPMLYWLGVAALLGIEIYALSVASDSTAREPRTGERSHGDWIFGILAGMGALVTGFLFPLAPPFAAVPSTITTVLWLLATWSIKSNASRAIVSPACGNKQANPSRPPG